MSFAWKIQNVLQKTLEYITETFTQFMPLRAIRHAKVHKIAQYRQPFAHLVAQYRQLPIVHQPVHSILAIQHSQQPTLLAVHPEVQWIENLLKQSGTRALQVFLGMKGLLSIDIFAIVFIANFLLHTKGFGGAD